MKVEEMGRYDPYTDKFIKNTTTDRIEVGTDGNLYRLSISNGNEFLSKDKLYTNADMVAMLEKIKERLDEEKSDYISKEELDIAYGIDRSLVYIESEIYALRGEKNDN